MFSKNCQLVIVAVAFVAVLGVTGAADKALAGLGYWDLFCVNLSPTDYYWNQISGTYGIPLNDPLVTPDPNGNALSPATTTTLGGQSYAFGGHDWGTGTLESTTVAGSNSISWSGTPLYLSVVLDSATAPFADQVYPSWGTVSNIAVTQQTGGGPVAYTPIWVEAPFDPNAGNIVNAAGDTVTLAGTDFDVVESSTQLTRVYGAGALLPATAGVTGYKVDFDTDLYTWDSYDLTGAGGGGGGGPVSQLGAVMHPYNILPKCENVQGKEFSNNTDEDSAGNADALQNVAFDCQGTSNNTYDYSGSAWPAGDPPTESHQVDAIANSNDAYYWPMAQDQVPMVVSFKGTTTATDGDIMYQMAKADTNGTWCTANQISAGAAKPDDVDGLELYGPENMENPQQGDDANMFSLVGDPGTAAGAGAGGVAVWQYHPNLLAPWPQPNVSLPYITTAALKLAIGIGDGLEYPDQEIDLDALMVYDQEYEVQFPLGFTFGTGDSIMFSLEETLSKGGSFDGGEIWLWTVGNLPVFLTHGGELWDTLHTVGLDFGVGTEEINALEAVADIPEPGTMALLAIGAVALIRRRRRA